jgi:hypothetical protein
MSISATLFITIGALLFCTIDVILSVAIPARRRREILNRQPAGPLKRGGEQ